MPRAVGFRVLGRAYAGLCRAAIRRAACVCCAFVRTVFAVGARTVFHEQLGQSFQPVLGEGGKRREQRLILAQQPCGTVCSLGRVRRQLAERRHAAGADNIPCAARLEICTVGNIFYAVFGDIALYLGARDGQQRAQHRYAAGETGDAVLGYAAEPRKRAAARESKEQCFELVICVMGGDDAAAAVFLSRLAQICIPQLARRLLKSESVRSGIGGYVGAADLESNAVLSAEVSAVPLVSVCLLTADAVVEVHGDGGYPVLLAADMQRMQQRGGIASAAVTHEQGLAAQPAAVNGASHRLGQRGGF